MTRRSLVRGFFYGTMLAAFVFAGLSVLLGGALASITGTVAAFAALTFWAIAFFIWLVCFSLGLW